jgi:hypothetical protein
VCRQDDLPHAVLTIGSASRLAGCLHRRQKQSNQHPDDRNYDQQFDQGKTATNFEVTSATDKV